MFARPTRRSVIKATSAILAPSALFGCSNYFVDISRPLRYGYNTFNLNLVSGGSGEMRVFYPTMDARPDGATFYAGGQSYPLILFLHGDYTTDRTWLDIPANLARAGFVVAVPDYGSDGPTNVITQDCFTVIFFMLRNSPFAKSLSGSIGVSGHSQGGPAALDFAQKIGAKAFAGLSGTYTDGRFSTGNPFQNVTCPLLLVWGSGEAQDSDNSFSVTMFTSLTTGLWPQIGRPKHLLTVINGRHFDYVEPNSPGLTAVNNVWGPCGRTPAVTAEFVTTFFVKYMQPTPVMIPDTLIPPPAQLLPQEAAYGSGFLTDLYAYTPDAKQPAGDMCRFAQIWDTNNPAQPTGLINVY